jgi:hypothetical protein
MAADVAVRLLHSVPLVPWKTRICVPLTATEALTGSLLKAVKPEEPP